jgi:uncharacterized protein
MKRIALLSDTHGHLDTAIPKYLESVDEIWHAGDIGDGSLMDSLEKIKPVRAVWGNIDSHLLRARYPEVQAFELEGVRVLMVHIGGNMPGYTPQIRALLARYKPNVFICGHSHLLKVAFDQTNQVLYVNPGAAGKHGFHKVKTLLRFSLDQGKIKDMEVVELGPRGSLK